MKGVAGVPGVAESSAICSNLLLSAVYLHFLHRNSFLCIFPLMNFSIVLIWEIWHSIFWSVLMGEGVFFLYICHFYGFRFYQQQMCKKKLSRIITLIPNSPYFGNAKGYLHFERKRTLRVTHIENFVSGHSRFWLQDLQGSRHWNDCHNWPGHCFHSLHSR